MPYSANTPSFDTFHIISVLLRKVQDKYSIYALNQTINQDVIFLHLKTVLNICLKM